MGITDDFLWHMGSILDILYPWKLHGMMGFNCIPMRLRAHAEVANVHGIPKHFHGFSLVTMGFPWG